MEVSSIVQTNLFVNCYNILGKSKKVRKNSMKDLGKRSRRKQEAYNRKSPASSPDEDDSDDDIPGGYHQISIQVRCFILNPYKSFC